jgi:predicted PolB exonuclease-like 3'-5' exonuclease
MITFDLETLQCTDEEVIESFRKSIKAPANYSKPETIAKWHEENGAQALADMVAKTSFDGLYGSIACIAWSIGGDVTATFKDQTEPEAITHFYEFIDNNIGDSDRFCGHNLAGFDLPFLKHRSIILGIRPPRVLMSAMIAKPWDNCISDTMLMWNPNREKYASMDKLCKAFGIKGKEGFDGSMVNEEWVNGDRSKVIEYCKDDVRRTIEIYNRITFSGK